ncbi:hypothetical protein [Riemerella columbipharyngis]|uniref:Uncharacterized protein n=1 Tax=Riemerella columbipharyngis TaxID=1071918 RepID=A0A1G6YCD8_9FLAO|nr:hypothetical protein [Riemerella columbipharyngis]SDD88000.1 hypothetical protein SAMN05421544_101109 [Riemerella columbipharyngis]
MRKSLKLAVLSLFLGIQFSCAQQIVINKPSDTRLLEVNKKEFIGKPLSYLLSVIKVPIKSVLAVPNKNKNEINMLYFRYITYDEYRRVWTKSSIEEGPTQLVVKFNQNWNMEGKLCKPIENPQCAEWLPEDEKNLGGLIVYDIYVRGKD